MASSYNPLFMPPLSRTAGERALAAIATANSDAIISADSELRITSWNHGAERLFGYSASEALGQSVALIAPPGEEPSQAGALTRVIAGDNVESVETIRRGKGGALISVVLTLAPVRDAGGVVTGVAALVRELADPQRTERAARRLAAIIESSDDAIISKDLDGIVTSWNEAAERIFGYTAPEMIGRSIRAIIPADRQQEEDEVLARIRSGRKVDHFETTRRRKDGSSVEISLTVSPVRDASGRVIGASKVARDISERRQVEVERARLFAASEEQSRVTNTLNDVGRVVAASLNRDSVVQAVTDAATTAVGAEFGAFFYNVVDPGSGGASQLHALAGAPLDAVAFLSPPRAPAVVAPAVPRGSTGQAGRGADGSPV